MRVKFPAQALARPDRRAPRRAQAIVEVAIVFPLLVVAALAVLQFGLYAHAQNVVTAAAEDSARVYAAQGDASKLHAQAMQRAKDMIKAGLGSTVEVQDVDVQPEASDPRPDQVSVTLKTRMRTLLPWIPFAEPYLPVSATARISKEHFRG